MLLPLLLNNLLESGDVHNLTATSVESASEVSSPSLGQVHALTASNVQSTSEVSSPAIGQVHALTATSVESTSEVTEPDITVSSSHSLTAVDVESDSEVSSPALGQVHVLTGVSVQSLSEVSLPALNGAEAVTVAPPSGGSARKHRKRYLIEVDGQYFEVDSYAEAEAFFQKAMAVAVQEAESQRERQAKRLKRGKRIATVPAPEIKSPNPEIQPLVSAYREDIESIYRQIAVDAELRELIRLRMLEEDDEEAIALLLH